MTVAADFRTGDAIDGSIHHGAAKIESAVVQIAPHVPNVLLGQIAAGAALFVYDCIRAIRVAIAVTSASERCFKEGLCCKTGQRIEATRLIAGFARLKSNAAAPSVAEAAGRLNGGIGAGETTARPESSCTALR